mgnify:CR=1 FL=1
MNEFVFFDPKMRIALSEPFSSGETSMNRQNNKKIFLIFLKK